MPRLLPVVTALLSLALTSQSSHASNTITKDVEDALNFYHYGKEGAIKFDLNYRYENVNQDNAVNAKGEVLPLAKQPQTANANTARLRLGFLTPEWNKLQAYAEYEGNLAMQDDYNNTLLNGDPTYSKVADPDKSELNQLWLSYKGIPDTVIKGGRQRIKLDDDRFIGNVGWRQMEMTYDSVLMTHNNQTLFGLTVNAGFIGNVQTITSTQERIEAPILNLNYKVGDWGNLVAYGYWLDYTEMENYEKSSQTFGGRFTGESPVFAEHYSLLYTAEFSNQQNYGHGITHYNADRINVMGGVKAFNISLQGAMEQLDGHGLNQTFDTPLGTNHAFQGWADLFLQTPKDGIRDVFATLTASCDNGSLVFTGMYHDFADDSGKKQYGEEWDFSVLKKFGKHYSILAKYAYYQAEGFNTDTQKIWVQGNINF